MTDQGAIDELIDRFRAESDPADPSPEAATDIVAAAWPTLDDSARAKLVVSGSRLMRDDDDLVDASVSDELAARVRRASGYIRYVPSSLADGAEGSSEAIEYVDFIDPGRSERIDVPSVDVIAMAGAGLVHREGARASAEEHAGERDRIERLRGDVQAGRISPDAISDDDYDRVVHTDPAGETQAGCMAWLLGVLVAIVAGVVVALITWDAVLFLVVAIGGSVVGFIAAFALPAVFHAIDTAWLRRGSESKGIRVMIMLAAGPATSLIVALVVLWSR